MTLVSFDATMKDFYPLPGERIKQYVVDMRREDTWCDETAPVIHVESHGNNDGDLCARIGKTQWHILQRSHGCDRCSDIADAERESASVKEWLAEKAKRPPICADRTKLSDEVAA